MLASSLMGLSSKQSQHIKLCDVDYSMQMSHSTGFAWRPTSLRFLIDTTSFYTEHKYFIMVSVLLQEIKNEL